MKVIDTYRTRKIGFGTLSFLLLIIGILWSFSIHEFCIGDNVLSALHLKAWSNGTSGRHYTIYYALIFLIPSMILGIKYNENLFAKVGTIGSIILTVVIASSVFMSVSVSTVQTETFYTDEELVQMFSDDEENSHGVTRGRFEIDRNTGVGEDSITFEEIDFSKYL